MENRDLKIKTRVQEKRGTLHVVVTFYKNGKRKERWKNLGLTPKGNKKRAEILAEKFEQEVLQEIESKLLISDRKAKEEILFFEYLAKYLENIKPTLSVVTYGNYYKLLDKRIRDHFELQKLTLNELTVIHLKEFYQTLFEDKLTPTTVIHYQQFIKKALSEAVVDELIEKNVAMKIKRPKKKQFHAGFYNLEEIKLLIDCVKNEKIRLPILFAIFYGLRRSEIVGLKWSAIDFVNKQFTIKHVLVEDPLNYMNVQGIDRTKNLSSYRTFPIADFILEELLKQKAWQEHNRQTFTSCYVQSDYVFTLEDGTFMKPDYFSKRFRLMIKRNNLRPIRLHDLRHSNASILLNLGKNLKQIQNYLGHASYSTTADIYTHLDTNIKQDSVDSLEAAFKKFSITK